MVTFLRNCMYNILGLTTYLRLVSMLYITGIRCGLWKSKYPELYFLKHIVKHGDTCIDIGANLGYYSTQLASIVGATGNVYAVEPIPLFGDIWKKNCKPHTYKQLTLFPYALGAKTDKVQMGIPVSNGRVHHGMTKIASTAQEQYLHFFDVTMRNPDELFSDIQQLAFIKCDVEGYESEVFRNFTTTIQKFKPIIQTELSGSENRTNVIQLLESMGYTTNVLRNNTLVPVQIIEALELSQDFYFVPIKE